MFRPFKWLTKSTALVGQTRHKMVFPESYLDKAQRLKLWHRDNLQLFGSLLKNEKKVRRRRSSKKEAEPEKESQQKTIGPKYHKTNQSVGKVIQVKNLKHTSLYEIPPQGENNVTNRHNSLIAEYSHLKLDKSNSRKNKIFGLPIKKINITINTLTSNLISAQTEKGKNPIKTLTPNVNLLSNSHLGVPSVIVRNLKMFPMMCNHQKEVTDINSSSSPNDTILRIPSGRNPEYISFPSVSQILDQTMSKESKAALQAWKEQKIAELGLQGFENYNRAQMQKGKLFHELVAHHLLTNQSNNIDQGLEGVWSSVTNLLKEINSPKALESYVIHPVLKYKGIIDCIAMYHDKPTLVEWKKSDKRKASLSSTFDNPVQLAAYFGAISHDSNYKHLQVRDALLVIAYTDGTPADAFHLSSEQMREHWANWLSRLEKYWATVQNKDDKKSEEPKKS